VAIFDDGRPVFLDLLRSGVGRLSYAVFPRIEQAGRPFKAAKLAPELLPELGPHLEARLSSFHSPPQSSKLMHG
jgi:hypothetical protein